MGEASRSMHLSDADLLIRLTNPEDQFTERKSASDKRGWVRTAVGFANSVPIGYPAVLFIGAKPDGTPENVITNFDEYQQTFSRELGQAYPPIPHFPKILTIGNKSVLAIIIPGSPNRPHFAGHSYIRVGSETRQASEEQFLILLAERNNKARKILDWKGREITVRFLERMTMAGYSFERGGSSPFVIAECNQHYVTLEHRGVKDSASLESVRISYDYQQNRLRLEVGLGS